MILEAQPLIPVRHYVNQCIMMLKVGQGRAVRKWRLVDTIAECLRCTVSAVAEREFGGAIGNGVSFAVADSIDKIRACRMYLDSYSQERNQLKTALSRESRLAISLRSANESVESAFPDWFQVLLAIVTLGRQHWIYMRLYRTRDTAVGWNGRLAELLLGDRGKASQCNADKNAFRAVIGELTNAYAEVGIGSSDSIVRLLESCDAAAMRCIAEVDSQEAMIRSIVDVVVRMPLSDFSKFTNLLAAIQDAVCLIRAMGRDMSSSAVEQLMQELLLPSRGFMLWGAIQSAMPFAKSITPRDILRDKHGPLLKGIAEMPPSPSAPGTAALPRHHRLVATIWADLKSTAATDRSEPVYRSDDLILRTFHSLCKGSQHDALPRGLSDRSPPPCDWPASWLRRVRDLLHWWQSLQYVLDIRFRAGRVDPDVSARQEVVQIMKSNDDTLALAFLELPRFAPQSPIEPTLQLVEGWISQPDTAPHDWHIVAPAVKSWLEAALIAVILDHFVSLMVSYYQHGGEAD